MPTGISQSVVTPAALAQRSMPDQTAQRPRQAPPSEGTANPQAVLASGRDTLVRAPDPETGSQEAENQLATGASSTLTSGARTPAEGVPPETPAVSYGPEGLRNGGIGGSIDLIV